MDIIQIQDVGTIQWSVTNYDCKWHSKGVVIETGCTAVFPLEKYMAELFATDYEVVSEKEIEIYLVPCMVRRGVQRTGEIESTGFYLYVILF